MTVSPRSRTTIGQLLYPVRPALNFARLVADLEAALGGREAEERRTTLERDNLAVIDAGASRVAIALMDGLDRSGATAVTITVGYGPDEDGDARLARRQSVLARLIAERVAARCTPAETLWSETFEIATPELFDRCHADLVERQRTQAEARAERARARRVSERHFVECADVPRMMARVDAALDARRSGGLVAANMNGAADLPPVDLSGLGEARSARKRASAPMRLAAHMIDATLMVVALPVGAAMMVYSLSRGADLNTSSRAMALTGIGIAVMTKMGGLGGLEAVFTQAI